MNQNRKRAAAALVLALSVMAGAGCTNTDVLGTSTGTVALVFEPSPSTAGRFENVRIGISQVRVRPEDPSADENLGESAIALMTTAEILTLTQGQDRTVAARPMNPGVYRITEITFTSFRLVDSNPPVPPATCLENFGTLPNSSVQSLVPSSFEVGGFGPEAVFTVPAAGQGELRILINSPAFASVFENAFTCQAATNCTLTFPPVPPPCLSGFTMPSQDALRTFLAFD